MMRSGSCSSLTSSDRNAATSAGTTTVLKKGPWTAAEDAILMGYVHKHGEGNWNAVQKNCGLARCGKSCRLRWANHLRPNLKKGSFTPEEEMLILQLHAQLGNKWARMAAQLPGRTDNEIKNFWNTRVKRRQRAGLPLYPSEIRQQQQRRTRPSPLNLPSSTSPAAMPLLFSPGDQRMKGVWVSTPPPTATGNMFHEYGYDGSGGGSYNETPRSSLMTPVYSPATVKTELPSYQLFNAGGCGGHENGCRLLDAMLEETRGDEGSARREMVVAEPIGAVKDFGGNGSGGTVGDDKDLFGESFPRFEDNGINVKREREEEINSISTQDDISKLFDMISTPGMPAAPEWYHTASDSYEISNGRQSSTATDDELGLELQNLASSLSVAPSEHDWNVGSCSWSNMPRIC